MPEIKKPKLTNRGGAGLYGKLKPEIAQGIVPGESPEQSKLTKAIAKYRIAPALQSLAVPIKSLVPDPMNARLHPERNLEAIKESLVLYGQVKPLVVRKSNNVVVAGNGTLECAKALGWTEIAVTYVDMNEGEAAGFGLADNRSAELAKWDFETVALLDKLIQEAGGGMVGWSKDELEVLRAADWIPPAVNDEAPEEDGKHPLLLSLTPDEREIVDHAITHLKAQHADTIDLSDGGCIAAICREWIKTVKGP